jgi:hypothetical protein
MWDACDERIVTAVIAALALTSAAAARSHECPVGDEHKFAAADPATDDWFGETVAIDGDTAAVAAINDDDGGTQSGSVYVFVRSGSTWAQQAKLVASDAQAFAYFGASLDIDGDTIVVGALAHDVDGRTDAGAAYVFERTGTDWAETARFTGEDPIDNFGISVAVSGDRVAVGAIGYDQVFLDTGAVYVYRKTGGAWLAETTLVGDAFEPQNVGWSIAMDGPILVAGAPFNDVFGAFSGAVLVFTHDGGGAWSSPLTLFAADSWPGGSFGADADVAWTGSEGRILVGAPGHDGLHMDAGAAYAYAWSGASWAFETMLAAEHAGSIIQYGRVVALDHGSGLDSALVGSLSDALNDGRPAAYYHRRSGTAWSHETTVLYAGSTSGTWFARAANLSHGASGPRVILGAREDNEHGFASGAAFVADLPCLCAGDFDDDGAIGFTDLLVLLAAWGPCGGACPEDLGGDGTVGFADLIVLLAAWGGCA